MVPPLGDPRPILLRRAREVLKDYPCLGYMETDAAQDEVGLIFPKCSESGFEVSVYASRDEVAVLAGGTHLHFGESRGFGNEAEIWVEEALGLARDLLSPAMRIRERLAGSKPYRWFIEYLGDSEWHTEHETSLLIWNYLGRRSERICQNHALPSRFDESGA